VEIKHFAPGDLEGWHGRNAAMEILQDRNEKQPCLCLRTFSYLLKRAYEFGQASVESFLNITPRRLSPGLKLWLKVS